MTAVIETRALTKTYAKGARGIQDVTLDVRKGEVFGFLGPNGAGKTTAIRLLMDALRPTSGEARVFGLDAREGRRDIHKRVGYLPGDMGLAGRDTVRVHLRFHANLRGGVPDERVRDLAHRLDLDLTRSVKALSRGNRQKVGIVQAFMHEPDLLLLDEPTSGLDPLMQQEFNKLVREAKANGRTTFLSSHILPEVEALCDRVAIIREGSVVAVDEVAHIKARAVRRVEATFSGPADARLLDGVPGVREVRADGRHLHFQAQGPLGPAMCALATKDLVDVLTREPTLEDVFLGYYGRSS